MEIKFLRYSSPSKSSTPIRHLIENGTSILFFTSFTHLLSNSTFFMRKTPKLPDLTFLEGQPTFRLISSYPYSWPMIAASARDFGSEPPN